jgi:hypothetical protein
MFNTICETGAVGAGAASRYGSVSDQMMWLRLRNTVQKTYNNNIKNNCFPQPLPDDASAVVAVNDAADAVDDERRQEYPRVQPPPPPPIPP